MHRAAVFLVIAGVAASPVAAQDRGRHGHRAQGIPPGHLPPPGQCRVWYDDRPAGHQPPPTDCREAERVAARGRYARVIYGSDHDRRDGGRWGRDDDRRGRGRAVPRRDPSRYPYPDRYPSRDQYPYPDQRYPYPDRYPGDRGRYGYGHVAFDNGYKDGYEKGREDARDRDSYDPVRHRRYRSADRGYNRRHGSSREEYKDVYREGFRAGYEEGYRDSAYERNRRRSGIRLPWPF